VKGWILAPGRHARRPPHTELDLGDDLLKGALSLARGPAVGVRPESDDLAPPVGADTEAVGGQPVLAIVCPNLTV